MTKVIDYFFGIGSPWSFIGLDAFRKSRPGTVP